MKEQEEFKRYVECLQRSDRRKLEILESRSVDKDGKYSIYRVLSNETKTRIVRKRIEKREYLSRVILSLNRFDWVRASLMYISLQISSTLVGESQEIEKYENNSMGFDPVRTETLAIQNEILNEFSDFFDLIQK